MSVAPATVVKPCNHKHADGTSAVTSHAGFLVNSFRCSYCDAVGLETAHSNTLEDPEYLEKKQYKPLLPQLHWKRLVPEAVAPFKAHEHDAGWDLTALTVGLGLDGLWSYGTGLAILIPDGYVGLLKERGSVRNYGGILVGGVIDAGYTGEISANFQHVNPLLPRYNVGDRVCQLVIVPIREAELVEVKELPGSERGTKGFGSSGR